MRTPARFGLVRRQRRALLLAIYGVCALGIGVTLAAPSTAVGGRGATSAPAAATRTVSPADKAASEAAFGKAKDLYQQNKFAEAQVENDKALKLDPTNVMAVLMQGTLKDKLAGGGLVTATSQGSTTAASGGKLPVLTAQQVSLIRLMELGGADNRVVGKIDPKVVEDFWQNVVLKDPLGDKSPAAHNAFINPSNFMGQVRRIRDSHEMKYMEQISLTTDPATFVTFRNNVHMYVLQNCATAECHGGEKSPGGNFHLLNPASASEQVYTNFYILSQYSGKDGKMIDRESPDKSLLLQYALPWQNSAYKHPKVDVKKLTGPTDARGRTIAEWIRALPIPRPNYGISYEVPAAAAPASASAPASAPK